MKLFVFFFLGAVLQSNAGGYAQGITLKVKDRPLQEVFAELGKQSGYNFVYTGEVLGNAGTVTADIKNKSLEEAVQICLKGKALGYTIVEKIVVIKPKADNNPAPPGGQGGGIATY